MEEAGVVPPTSTSTPAASASVFLVLLLVGDLVYIAIHLVWTETKLLNSPLAALDVDRGYAEFFQYMKLLWAALLITFMSLRTRRWGYLAWAFLFAYLLLDDSFSVHENLGKLLAVRLALPAAFGLRAVDFGELLMTAMAGAVMTVILGWAYLRGGPELRRSSRHMLVLLLAIVFFGVGVDMVHSAIHPVGWMDNALVILEDGGELVVSSFIAWYAFLLVMVGDSSSGPTLAALLRAVFAHARALSGLRR